jgi:phosphoribosylanthranilate isomerase
MMGLKICGLQAHDDVSFTAHPGVSHVGFVFVPSSRRYIRPEDAALLVNRLVEGTTPVGVVVDTSYDDIVRIATIAKIRAIQLHGSEPPELAERLRASGFTVWKAISVSSEGVPEGGNFEEFSGKLGAYAQVVDAILFDTAPPKTALPMVTGGHGRPFDWTILPELSEMVHAHHPGLPVWVAGGVTPENAPELLSNWRPSGIDVSSGVEVDGRKSIRRIQQMVEVVSRGVRQNISR